MQTVATSVPVGTPGKANKSPQNRFWQDGTITSPGDLLSDKKPV